MIVPHTARRLFGEPLLQFLLLGTLLFAADRYVASVTDDPRRIVIGSAKRENLATIFQEGQGRPPSPEELQQLVVQWSQNEVLYREARYMALDKGDEMIRQRLILKLRNVLFGSIIVRPPSNAELRQWFDNNRSKYDRPPLFDFEQFQLGSSVEETEARQLSSTIATGEPPEQYASQLRSYRARPLSNLVSLFGMKHADSLVHAATSTWRAVHTDHTWHIARITRRLAAQPANFQELRSQIVREWKDEARKTDLSSALKAIVERYEIRVVGSNSAMATKPSKADPTSQLPIATGQGL